MAMRVERRGDEYCVVISQEALATLRLTAAAAAEVRPAEEKPVEAQPAEVRYVTVAEALAAFDRTEPLHRNSYRELAQ